MKTHKGNRFVAAIAGLAVAGALVHCTDESESRVVAGKPDGATPTGSNQPNVDGGSVDAPTMPGLDASTFFPSNKFVYVAIGMGPTLGGAINGPYEIRIYPPEYPSLRSTVCSAQIVDSCMLRKCSLAQDGGTDAGAYDDVLSGQFTITNETVVDAGRPGAVPMVSFDLAASRLLGIARAASLKGVAPGDDIHIVWTGASRLPPVDVRMKMPAAAQVQFETDPPEFSAAGPTKLAWTPSSSWALARVTSTGIQDDIGTLYCPFDTTRSSEGSISARAMAPLGVCGDGGVGQAFVNLPGYAMREIPGAPISVVVGLESVAPTTLTVRCAP